MEICKLCNREVDSVTHIAEQWLIDTIKEKIPTGSQKTVDVKNAFNTIKASTEYWSRVE